MPIKHKAPIAVGMGIAALVVLGLASVLGWDLGAYVDGALKGFVGAVGGYLVPSPSDQKALP